METEAQSLQALCTDPTVEKILLNPETTKSVQAFISQAVTGEKEKTDHIFEKLLQDPYKLALASHKHFLINGEGTSKTKLSKDEVDSLFNDEQISLLSKEIKEATAKNPNKLFDYIKRAKNEITATETMMGDFPRLSEFTSDLIMSQKDEEQSTKTFAKLAELSPFELGAAVAYSENRGVEINNAKQLQAVVNREDVRDLASKLEKDGLNGLNKGITKAVKDDTLFKEETKETQKVISDKDKTSLGAHNWQSRYDQIITH